MAWCGVAVCAWRCTVCVGGKRTGLTPPEQWRSSVPHNDTYDAHRTVGCAWHAQDERRICGEQTSCVGVCVTLNRRLRVALQHCCHFREENRAA